METINNSINDVFLMEMFNNYFKNSRNRRLRISLLISKLKNASRRRKRLIAKYMGKQRRNNFVRSCWVQVELLPPVAPAFFEDTVPHYSDMRFLRKFRTSKKTFSYIVEELKTRLTKDDTVMRTAVPVDKRVAIAISMLKSNCDLWTIADLFKVGKSTVAYILLEFCTALVDHFYNNIVEFPNTEEKRKAVSNFFWHRWQFPGTFGAMDGCHIPILAPHNCPEDYYNYKSFYSINLLAVVDYNYKFIYANIGRPGRMNDAGVFQRSGLYKQFTSVNGRTHLQQTEYHIISDGAFPLLTWVLKPYPTTNSMTIQQRNYNYRLSSARMVIEDSFGRLKGRWRILLKRADFKLENMKLIVQACLVLHNLCEANKDFFCPEWLQEVQKLEQYHSRTRRPIYNDNNAPRSAVLKRNAVAEHLMQDGHTITYAH